jgi:predicted XRE-type DNA-binding protein
MKTTRDHLQFLIDQGLTQIEISNRTNIPQPRISRWMADGVPKTADDALRLAELAQQVGHEKLAA